MCDPKTGKKTCGGKCRGKGKCGRAFLTVKGQDVQKDPSKDTTAIQDRGAPDNKASDSKKPGTKKPPAKKCGGYKPS